MTNSIPLSEMESSPAATFNQHGDKYVGRITTLKWQQQTDPKTGAPKVFSSGEPMMILLITIQPPAGDAVTLWAKGGSNFTAAQGSGHSMLVAISRAARAAGAENVDVGAELAVAYTGDTEASPGMNPAKLYTAEYRPTKPVTESVPVDLFSS
jgi:hypothetical protein